MYDNNYSFKEKKKKFNFNLRKNLILKESKVNLRKEIDFGGFGKGYAVDRVRKILDSAGLKDYLLNAGGDIYVKGKTFSKVYMENPDDIEQVFAYVELDAQSIASSSASRRKWGKNHHLIDPKKAKSAEDMKSVFVISRSAMEADMYATALYVLGFKKAVACVKRKKLVAFLVSKDNQVYRSKGFHMRPIS